MGNAEGRAPRRAEPRGNPGSFDELHRLCKEVFPPQLEGVKLIVTKTLSSHFQVTHTVHMSALGPSGYRFNATFVGDRQLGPAEVFPTLLGDMDSSGSLNAQAVQLLGERLRAKAVFQTHQARFVTWQFDGEYRGEDCTATLTLGNPDLLGGSERHRPPGARRGARVPPAARRGGSHPHPGREVLGPELGDNAQRGLRRRPRQLLPPCQRAGAGGGRAGGQHAAAGEQLRLRLPAQPAAGQRRLQRAPGQQLERGRGAGEEAAPPARDAGAGRLPEPLEEPVPLRLQRHRGLRDRGQRGQQGQDRGQDSRDSTAGTAQGTGQGTAQQGQRGQWGQQGQHSRDRTGDSRDSTGDRTAGTGQGTAQQGQRGQWGQQGQDRGQQGQDRGQDRGDSRDRTGDRTAQGTGKGTGQYRGQQGQDRGDSRDRTGDSTAGTAQGTGQREQQGLDSRDSTGDRTAGTAGTGQGTAQQGQHRGQWGQQGQHRRQDSTGDRTEGTAGTGQQGQHRGQDRTGDRAEGTGQRGLWGQQGQDRGQQGHDSRDTTAGTGQGTAGTGQQGQDRGQQGQDRGQQGQRASGTVLLREPPGRAMQVPQGPAGTTQAGDSE